MSFNDCKEWPKYCTTFTCYPIGKGPNRPASSWGECFSTVENRGPFDFKHQIRTDYSITLCNVNVPIVKTTRDWITHEYWGLSIPTAIDSVYLANNSTSWCFAGFTTEERDFRATENCEIIKSTLHYLDHRFKVCLYRKNIERVSFSITTDQTNLFKTPYNTVRTSSIKIYGGDKKNWDSLCTEEWHLVIDGVDTIIATSSYDPLPEMRTFAVDGSSDLFNQAYPNVADKDLELILSTSPPTSYDAIPWDDELRYHGFYSYRGGVRSVYWGADGGAADYFYPAWCRALHEDPFWREAADIRLSVLANPYWDGSYNKEPYSPPIDLIVDPLPRGTFVKHPLVGEVWQFLIGKRDGSIHLETSPNLDELIKASLNKNGVSPVQGTMLYYPIGV